MPSHPHLVLLQIPALDLLVEAAGEHVRVSRADNQAGHLQTQSIPAIMKMCRIHTIKCVQKLLTRLEEQHWLPAQCGR